MLLRWLMNRYGWDTVWAPGMGDVSFQRRWLAWDSYRVGIWTGPDMDMLCTKWCATDRDAERWLSPGGPTMLLAAMCAVAKHYRTKMRPRP
jgi:hypothetical protein